MAGVILGTAGCRKDAAKAQPEALIKSGWNNYRLGEFGLAVRDFEAARTHAGRGSSSSLGALYGLAVTWDLRRPDQDPVKAEALFREVIETAPASPLAAWSMLDLANMKCLPVDGARPDVAAQVKAYGEVVARYPGTPAGEEAFLMLQAARLAVPGTNSTQAILDDLQAFAASHGQSPWLSTTYTLMAQCGWILERPQERLTAFMQAWKSTEIDPANPLQDLSWTYWQIATIAEFDIGDFALARDYYTRLIAEYPTEQKVFLAKQELRRMDQLEAEIRAEGSRP